MSQDQNPKYVRAQKDGKAPLEFLVTTVFEGDAAIHKHGADKYGRLNWRRDAIAATTYAAAMMRHLKAWTEGENFDQDSGRSHLYHLRACCAIVLDADMHGKLIDDRLDIGYPPGDTEYATVTIEPYIPVLDDVETESPSDGVTEPEVAALQILDRVLSTNVTEEDRLAAAEIERIGDRIFNENLDFIDGCGCTQCKNTALVAKVRAYNESLR